MSNNDSKPYLLAVEPLPPVENQAFKRYNALLDELRSARLAYSRTLRTQDTRFNAAHV